MYIWTKSHTKQFSTLNDQAVPTGHYLHDDFINAFSHDLLREKLSLSVTSEEAALFFSRSLLVFLLGRRLLSFLLAIFAAHS